MDTVRLGYDTSILLLYLTLKIISTHSIVTPLSLPIVNDLCRSMTS